MLYGVLFWIVRRAALIIQRQQEQLVEAETLAAVGEMASAIAHNIRNPLASIRVSAEVALEEEPDYTVHQQLEGIRAEVDQLERQLRELLTYAQPLQFVPAPVQILALLQQTLHPFAELLDRQGVRLIQKTMEPLPPLQADPYLLQRAFSSVIANAMEAMPQGGTLTIAAGLVANRQQVQIQISDTGHGIPSDTVDEVFRPFFTTKPKGLGIGLAFAKRIVERHGGTITLTSTESHGTIVSLSLPITQGRERALPRQVGESEL